MKTSSARWVIASFWLMMLMTGLAAAQTYPARPVRVIVPFPPAGAADIVARAITQEMSKAWGAQVVVDNRAGAGGLIGAEQAARAAPDGYTLLFASASPMTVSPHLTAKPPYHPLKDFTPIILIGFSPNVLVVHPSLPARSMKALITLAKSRPGQINYASNGVGTLSHLAAELIKFQAGNQPGSCAVQGRRAGSRRYRRRALLGVHLRLSHGGGADSRGKAARDRRDQRETHRDHAGTADGG